VNSLSWLWRVEGDNHLVLEVGGIDCYQVVWPEGESYLALAVLAIPLIRGGHYESLGHFEALEAAQAEVENDRQELELVVRQEIMGAN